MGLDPQLTNSTDGILGITTDVWRRGGKGPPSCPSEVLKLHGLARTG
jgi:hypothetical protein